jgi:hypothetical protein
MHVVLPTTTTSGTFQPLVLGVFQLAEEIAVESRGVSWDEESPDTIRGPFSTRVEGGRVVVERRVGGVGRAAGRSKLRAVTLSRRRESVD